MYSSLPLPRKLVAASQLTNIPRQSNDNHRTPSKALFCFSAPCVLWSEMSPYRVTAPPYRPTTPVYSGPNPSLYEDASSTKFDLTVPPYPVNFRSPFPQNCPRKHPPPRHPCRLEPLEVNPYPLNSNLIWFLKSVMRSTQFLTSKDWYTNIIFGLFQSLCL